MVGQGVVMRLLNDALIGPTVPPISLPGHPVLQSAQIRINKKPSCHTHTLSIARTDPQANAGLLMNFTTMGSHVNFKQLKEINISTVEWRGYSLISKTDKQRDELTACLVRENCTCKTQPSPSKGNCCFSVGFWELWSTEIVGLLEVGGFKDSFSLTVESSRLDWGYCWRADFQKCGSCCQDVIDCLGSLKTGFYYYGQR